MKLFKDMDENQFWLTVWSLAATAVVIMSLVFTDSANKEDVIIKQLIKDGYDPIALSCIYSPSERNQLSCLILAQANATKSKSGKKKK